MNFNRRSIQRLCIVRIRHFSHFSHLPLSLSFSFLYWLREFNHCCSITLYYSLLNSPSRFFILKTYSFLRFFDLCWLANKARELDENCFSSCFRVTNTSDFLKVYKIYLYLLANNKQNCHCQQQWRRNLLSSLPVACQCKLQHFHLASLLVNYYHFYSYHFCLTPWPTFSPLCFCLCLCLSQSRLTSPTSEIHGSMHNRCSIKRKNPRIDKLYVILEFLARARQTQNEAVRCNLLLLSLCWFHHSLLYI